MLDTYTKNIKKDNKSCLSIFSDGATATLIKKLELKIKNIYFIQMVLVQMTLNLILVATNLKKIEIQNYLWMDEKYCPLP